MAWSTVYLTTNYNQSNSTWVPHNEAIIRSTVPYEEGCRGLQVLNLLLAAS